MFVMYVFYVVRRLQCKKPEKLVRNRLIIRNLILSKSTISSVVLLSAVLQRSEAGNSNLLQGFGGVWREGDTHTEGVGERREGERERLRERD